MQEAFHQNRVSGLAFALLTSTSDPALKPPQSPKEEILLSEMQLYNNILNMTHYRSKGLRLIDYEDTDIVVKEQFLKFSSIYRPFLLDVEPFKNSV